MENHLVYLVPVIYTIAFFGIFTPHNKCITTILSSGNCGTCEHLKGCNACNAIYSPRTTRTINELSMLICSTHAEFPSTETVE